MRRTVRNVGDSVRFYHAEVTGLEGIDVNVSPSRLVVAPGAEASFDVTFTYAGAELGEYAEGHLTWVSGDIEVRSPIVVQPVALAGPDEVSGQGTQGSLTYEVTAGADEPIDLSFNGLTQGTENAGTLPPGEVVLTPQGNEHTAVYRFQVPEGTTLARFDLNGIDNGDDFDLYVVNEEFTQIVGRSATGAADEQVTLRNPEPGNYYVLVGAFSTEDGRPGSYVLTNYAVGDGPAGNATVRPQRIDAEAGETYEVTVSWSGLQPEPYLGYVEYGDAIDRITIVSIDGAAGEGSGGGGSGEERPQPVLDQRKGLIRLPIEPDR